MRLIRKDDSNYFPVSIIPGIIATILMLRNYITIAWRNLLRAPGFSLINIFGLAAGMSVALLIGIWIHDELSFNRSFENYDRIVQVYHHLTFGDQEITTSASSYPMASAMKTNYEDFEEVAMCSSPRAHILKVEDARLSETGMFADPSFLKIFSIEMIHGTHEPLKEMHSIIFSRSLAQKLFGDAASALGKIVHFDGESDLMVTGVFQDFPANSNFENVKLFVAMEYYLSRDEYHKSLHSNWESFDFDCYALLRPGMNAEAASKKIEGLIYENGSNDAKAINPRGFVFPMKKWHLYVDFNDFEHGINRIRFVWMFGLVGAFVLVLACINFMNLSTARSEMRAKEVGVRKVMGSPRLRLVRQFLAESLLVVTVSFLVALLIAWFALPVFSDLADKRVHMPWRTPLFYVIAFSFLLITALLAGSYPSLYLSSFNPVQVLKGTFKADRSAALFRKVMVIFQFSISLLLIICTLVVYMEIRHAKNRFVGFDRAGIIYMARTRDLANTDYDILRSELMATGAVENMAKSDFPVTGAAAADASLTWEGKDPAVRPLIGFNTCSHDFPATNGFQFVAGRDFSRERASDSSAVIINELAADLMGGNDALGKAITFASGAKYQVIGIIKDQIRWTPFSNQSPHMYFIRYDGSGHLTIRLNSKLPVADAIDKVKEVIVRHDPDSPFEYKFQDDDYGRLFVNEERTSRLAAVFTVLAIGISCVGMFGLAAFAASQRTKEIGVRKVFGASVFRLWGMLSLEFVFLVAAAIAVSFPLAWYLADQWLSQYDYRIELSWKMFGSTAVLALVVTLATVSYQALRAALMNPVETLRNN